MMSASLQVEREHWKNGGRFACSGIGADPSIIEMERFFRNADQNKIVAPLREARAAQAKEQRPKRSTEEKRRAALALQQRWNGWLQEREQVRNDIKRGKECLE